MFNKLLLLAAMASFCLIPGATTLTQAAEDGQPVPTDAPATQSADQETSPSKVFALVNGQSIYEDDLEQMVNMMMMNQFQNMSSPDGTPQMPDFQAIRDQVKKEARKQIISMTAFRQAVEKKMDSVTEKDVDERVAQITKVMEDSGMKMEDVLNANRMTPESFREDLKRQAASVKVVEEVTGEKMIPTEEQMKEFFDAHKAELGQKEMLQTSNIMFTFPQGHQGQATEEQKAAIHKKAEDALARIKAGEDFGKLANELSDMPADQAPNGDMGSYPRGQLPEAYENAAWALKTGEVSDIVESPFGYHIIKVTGHTEAIPAEFDKIKGRIREELIGQKMRANLDMVIEKLMSEAEVEILIPEEPATASEDAATTESAK